MNNIVMIPVEQLHHHPENPRLDLGDLTELAESIRANGIMQNLTVVPGHRMTKQEWVAAARAEGADKASAEASYDPERAEVSDGYTVVIGNRRMEAAKMAGLAEVQCVVSDMDHRTQIATMLQENMQRADLTVYEQAQGFQMMMDLGFTEKEIGEKTGFSEKTVKDRIKLTKLNKNGFEKAVQQGATLMDLVEISRLESKAEQNEVLKVAGTNNFREALKRRLRDQNFRKARKHAEPIVKEYAEELPEKANMWGPNPDVKSAGQVEDASEPEEKIRRVLKKAKKESPEDQLFYRFREYWNTEKLVIEIYKKNRKDKKQLTEEEKTERQKAMARSKHVKEVKDCWAHAYQLRRDFIRSYGVNVNGTGMSNISKLIMKYALRQRPSWGTTYNKQWDKNRMIDLMGLAQEEYEDKHRTVLEMLEGRSDIPQIRAVVAWICSGGVFWSDDPEHGLYQSWDGSWSGGAGKGKDNEVSDMYEFLKEIGYQMSDMEIQLMDGTHPVYKEAEA